MIRDADLAHFNCQCLYINQRQTNNLIQQTMRLKFVFRMLDLLLHHFPLLVYTREYRMNLAWVTMTRKEYLRIALNFPVNPTTIVFDWSSTLTQHSHDMLMTNHWNSSVLSSKSPLDIVWLVKVCVEYLRIVYSKYRSFPMICSHL